MNGRRLSEGWSRRYPPVGGALGATLIALLVLPSALNIPQSNPSQTLEFAPIPPEDDTPPPDDSGNTSSLGLGSSSTAPAGDAPGGDGPGGVLPSVPIGIGDKPVTKRCVGNPPRQTEDGLAPPCVAHFGGDNLGATSPGVTADQIKVVINLDACNGAATSEGYDTYTLNTWYDLGEPRWDDEEPVFIRALRRFQVYFNDRYQTYDRYVRFYVYANGKGCSTHTPEERQAEAALMFDHQGQPPFATLGHLIYGNDDVYLKSMAQRGVVTFSPTMGRDESFFAAFPGHLWSYPPSVQQQAQQYGSYLCQKVVPHPVSFSGNDGDLGKPRKLGLLYADNPAYPGYKTFAQETRRHVEACGGEIALERTFGTVGRSTRTYMEDPSPTTAVENMTAFQQNGVTTIAWAQGYRVDHPREGARAEYRPEWVLAGDGSLDGFNGNAPGLGPGQDYSAFQHAWIVSNVTLAPATAESACAKALSEADPAYPTRDAVYVCDFSSFYPMLRTLFTGIQVAGPDLKPESMERGFRAIPAVPSNDPATPSCHFVPGDYTCVKDAVAMWWDTEGIPPGGWQGGCWRMAEFGKRHLAWDWPEGDVLEQKNLDDPCNGFAGSYGI